MKQNNTLFSIIYDFLKTLLIAAFLAFFLIRGFIFEPYKIPSSSMVPTLLVGDFLFVSKYAYGNRFPLTDYFFWEREPERGDIVVFKKESDLPGSFFGFGETMFIKRLVALPGDTIAYSNKKLIINGQEAKVTYLDEYSYYARNHKLTARRFEENLVGVKHDILIHTNAPVENVREMTVPKGMYVVMGDNRDNSKDARFWAEGGWGFVPKVDIIGRAEFIFWSMDKGWKLRFERFFHTLRNHNKG